jgi:hypothetical protein
MLCPELDGLSDEVSFVVVEAWAALAGCGNIADRISSAAADCKRARLTASSPPQARA